MSLKQYLINLKNSKMSKTQNIKREHLKLIYDAVCDGWKKKIADVILWNNNSVIEVDEALVLEGYNAGDEKQKTLLEKYFKIPEQVNMNSLKSYENACKIVGKRVRKKGEFEEEKEWIAHQLERWIEAANFIDNGGKEWKPNFETEENRYIPYFIRKRSGWVLHSVHCYGFFISHYSVCFQYKKESTAKLIVERCQSLYDKWLG